MFHFIKETWWTIFTQILTLILGIGASIVLNRTLGPTGKGEFVILFLIPQLIVTLSNLGIGTSTSYFIGKKIYKSCDVIAATFIWTLFIGIIGILAGFFSIQAIRELPGYIGVLLLFTIVTGIWFNFCSEFFIGKDRIKLYNIWNLLQTGGRFFVLLVVIYFFTNKLYGAILCIVFLNITVFFLSFFVLKRTIGNDLCKKNITTCGRVLKDGIKFGYKVFILEAMGFLIFRLGILLLKLWTDNASIGYYSTAIYIAEVLWLIPRAVYYVLYSKAVSNKMDSDFSDKMLRLSLWIVFALGGISALIIKPVILLLYGSDFIPATIPYIILLPGIIGFTIPWILGSQIIGRWGKPELLIPGRTGALILNITMNIILIPQLGIAGAALAASITYLSEASYYVYVYTRRTKKSVKELLIIKAEDIKILCKKQ